MSKTVKLAHASPQMSVEALALYATTTNATQRRTIIRDQKYYDSVAQPPYYREIKRAALRHLCDPEREDGGLLDAASRITLAPGAGDYERQRLMNNVSGLKCLHACRDEFILDELPYQKPPALGHYAVAGVKVIATPVAALGGTYRGSPSSGCLKLCLSKSDVLSEESAAYIGSALTSFVAKSFEFNSCQSKHVVIVDVFRSKTYLAPSARKRRLKTLEDACSDVAMIWHSV